MGLNGNKCYKYMVEAKGNTTKAMVIYIAKEGCNGFRCKRGGCPLALICTHNPEDSRKYAILALQEAERIEEGKRK